MEENSFEQLQIKSPSAKAEASIISEMERVKTFFPAIQKNFLRADKNF
jgi:hypothetical protein